ncbi:MAG TPA: bile acid:sodium symporter family protein [Verrucomicrobiae bacterium]|nr:bile acid:sodium symporter family protein [Verrucomicrobiae bacterium]
MNSIWQPIAVVLSVVLAIGLRFVPRLRGYQFTAWIIAAVMAAMIYPAAFLKWGSLELNNQWLILLVVQLVMFGMGTQMSLRDFAGVARSPRGVLIGTVGRFTVMPLAGWVLIKIFHFPAEIAAGVILIGSCSSGLASNVMAYLAQANLALSVTITAVTTMLAPVMTPFWMKLLAGTLVQISAFKMMTDIIKIVLVPIGAALLHDYLKHASSTGRKTVLLIATLGAAWLIFLAAGGWSLLSANLAETPLQLVGVAGFWLSASVIGVVYHGLTRRFPRLDRWMPLASMAGIVYFTAVTTAAGRDNLLQIGVLLFIVAVLHNTAGYVFGYWLSRATGLDQNSSRSVAFEVGLQNGGMASGLAGTMGKLGTVGLAAAIFSPWMNVSGSVLANYWRKKPAVATVQAPLAPQHPA